MSKQKHFYCPLGYAIMWWHGLEYSECPLPQLNRDMPECKECKLKSEYILEPKEKSDKPAKKKRKPRRRKQRRNK